MEQLMRRQTGDILTIKQYLTTVRFEQTSYYIKQGGLTCSIWANKSCD